MNAIIINKNLFQFQYKVLIYLLTFVLHVG